ncbi:MAG: methyltransferase domain-containing protein [Candidatus Omnitrophica bacterium]|nr:methyltransferase domain-containing protein [Candidatus Omnitrophota bacterium]
MNNFIGKNLNLIRLSFKEFLFPGMDFCLRKRLKLAKKYLLRGGYKTLDAGCGNGAFSFLCYKLGNSVLGIDINYLNIKKCLEFRDYRYISPSRLKFLVFDIYDILKLNETFDQIICFETLEHILRDRYILELFAKILNPNGIIHLGVPNLNCPYYYGEKISNTENGGHVRKGYDYFSIQQLIKGLGLDIIKLSGYGGIFTRKVTALSRRIQYNYVFKKSPVFLKHFLIFLWFSITYPLTYLDGLFKEEFMSIYIIFKKSE